ncbi:MAG: DUF1822 family protein [Nodosilinea sp.]
MFSHLSSAVMSFSELPFEFDPLQPTTVLLPPEAVDWAAQISQSEPDEQQWQSYLRALALKGFHQWLAAGADDIAPYYDARQSPAVGVNCRVGDFRLCLVVQSSLGDDMVSIPIETVDGSDFAHLYVLVEVLEEAERVTVLGSLRRDKLKAALKGDYPKTASSNDTYTLPVQLFDTAPEQLLLYLSCLNPEQLAGAAAVQSPATSTASIIPINVGRWLRDRLDTVADSLAWTLMPPLAPAHQMMSVSTPEETLETMLKEVAPSGITIPPSARGAFTDLQQIGLPMRLYALVWPLLEANPPEWSLLLFLGSVSGEALPAGTRLVIKDDAQTLVEQTLAPDSNASYLYAQVIGDWHEQFTATVELANGVIFHCPPFAISLDD